MSTSEKTKDKLIDLIDYNGVSTGYIEHHMKKEKWFDKKIMHLCLAQMLEDKEINSYTKSGSSGFQTFYHSLI